MPEKLNITVMLGGPSAEREVSLRSGAAVAKALRSLGHDVTEVDPKDGDLFCRPETDAVFLALHGTYGEDGTVQRQLEELGAPYTGCDAEASRIAFDKVLTKKRCLDAGVPTAKFLVRNRKQPRCRKICNRRWWSSRCGRVRASACNLSSARRTGKARWRRR